MRQGLNRFFIFLLLIAGCATSVELDPVYSSGMVFDGRPKTVMIISFDGLRPDAIDSAGAKHLLSLRETGVRAKRARTIHPSITLPSHGSMISGVAPAKHEILWNHWDPSKGVIRVPTLFDEAKKRGLTTAMSVGKEKFKHLARPGSVDYFSYRDDDVDSVVENVQDLLRVHRPNLIFIHFALIDRVGHRKGWMTKPQLDAIREADRGLGRILATLRETGTIGSTAIIVTADHGGSAKNHGDASEESMNIPWIAVGAGVPKDEDHILEKTVTTYDTAATAAALLGIPIPKSWDGKSAF